MNQQDPQAAGDMEPDRHLMPPAPPVHPGMTPDAQSMRQAVWPMVIGIILIVWAAFSILVGLYQMVIPLIMPMLALAVPGQASLEQFTVWYLVVGGGSTALGILLLVSGILLIKRRPKVAGLCLAWALIKIIVVIGEVILSYFVQQVQMASAISGAAGGPGAAMMQSSLMFWMQILGLVIVLLWGWALPVFVLIWFSLRSVKQEISSWSNSILG